MAKSAHPNVDKAMVWGRSLLRGKVPACRYIHQAVQRHFDEMAASRKRGFRFKFDPAKAEKKLKLMQLLPHTKGEWAFKRQRITLEGWQLFGLAVTYGWVKKKGGHRRFRESYWEVPRKNGKSVVAGGVGICMFVADDEYGAEVYSGATTEKQAWEVFRPAKLMVTKSPNLIKAAGIEVNASNMNVPSDFSRLVATERLDTAALPGMRRATIRDLIAPGETEAGSLEYVRETGFTNNAATVPEGSAKPYSEIETALITASVRTIAHLFKASRQILDDAKALQSYIDARARYGLLLAEEAQLLYGSGAGANLQGLVPVANQYASPAGWTVTGEQRIDRIRLALHQYRNGHASPARRIRGSAARGGTSGRGGGGCYAVFAAPFLCRSG
ncbi:phage major capsid protein [Pseudomonas syringae pv. syringae]|uniref:phage major capsid protein n=2 Tax=Pseudomonas syringae TaxID=317 RepID=UPI000B27E566|nr:phage major capsid protein [Pseudomonas syringae]MCH5548105.1 phage major capsid protein [Pseudomonas syringae pv. syringae]MCH5568933.1 phage major capsid protein [Pseudomonas syringae pv. syringae]